MLNASVQFSALMHAIKGSSEIPMDAKRDPPRDVMQPTRVLLLLNCVAPHELEDEEEYEATLEDLRDECQKYGKVLRLVTPRLIEPDKPPPDYEPEQVSCSKRSTFVDLFFVFIPHYLLLLFL